MKTNPLIKARVVADSIGSQNSSRITTFVLEYPRIIHSEFMTHRALSKNSASSRAIPFKKMVKMVQEAPFIPTRWMKEHTGMQGNEYFTDQEVIDLELIEDHLTARDMAVMAAKNQSRKGVSKQVCNRYLEPFLMHTVICTGTEWENFFALRADPEAEIHIQELAFKMLDAYNESTPLTLEIGMWHIPFGEQFNHVRLNDLMPEIQPASMEWYDEAMDDIKIKIATARCARVSYLNFEGKDDYEADIKLFDRLKGSKHWSPFEHCAQYMGNTKHYGNFKGWKQLRQNFPNENQTDLRVIKK